MIIRVNGGERIRVIYHRRKVGNQSEKEGTSVGTGMEAKAVGRLAKDDGDNRNNQNPSP